MVLTGCSFLFGGCFALFNFVFDLSITSNNPHNLTSTNFVFSFFSIRMKSMTFRFYLLFSVYICALTRYFQLLGRLSYRSQIRVLRNYNFCCCLF